MAEKTIRKAISKTIARTNPDELGLGEKFTGGEGKLINADGTFNIKRIGTARSTIFEKMISMSWWQFIGVLFSYFIVINLIFAVASACLDSSSFSGIDSTSSYFEKVVSLFYFSIHTFTTIGYGNMYPVSNIAHIIVVMIAFVGLLTVAIATGVVFFRFSKAKVYIRFSKAMVISPHKDGEALIFRIVNTTSNPLINVEANITATWLDDVDGIKKRRFERLPLELSFVYLLPLNWTVVHPITEESPVAKKSTEELNKEMMEFIIMIKAYDNLYGQPIFKNFSYKCTDIQRNAKFKIMYHYDEEEGTILDIDKIDDIELLN